MLAFLLARGYDEAGGDAAQGRRSLAAAGIPDITGRMAALRDLLLQAPAPVVAGMLGCSTARARHLAAAAGSTWKIYAPGDHRTP